MSFDKTKLIDDIKSNELKAKARVSNYRKKAIAFDLTKESEVDQLVMFTQLVNCSAYNIESHSVERDCTRDEFRNTLCSYIEAIHDTEKVVMLSRTDYDNLLANQKKTRKKKSA